MEQENALGTPSEIENTPTQSINNAQRTPTPISSHSSSSTSKKRRNTKVTKSEVKEEDEIFFKDDTEPSDASVQERVMDICVLTQQSQQLSARRRQIIQDILVSFDLEEVMDRFRGDSVNRSLSRRKFRQWLNSAMADDKVHLSDRQWNEQFRQKVLEEFEKKQDDREKQLAEAENQRILRLRLQGIIRDEEEEAKKQDAANKKTISEKRFDQRITRKHQGLFKTSDIETQMQILNRCERQKISGGRHYNGDGSTTGSIHGNDEENINDVGNNTLPTYKSQLGRTKADIKEDNPRIKELYEEEDLQQLYKEAESLVRRTTRNK